MKPTQRGIRMILFLLLFPPVSAAGAGGLVASGAWLRAAPTPSLPLAGYLRLDNTGVAPVTLRAASSPEFVRVEWHASEVVDGVARMRRVGPPTLAPGASLVLAPGGAHLMLFEPVRALAAGDRVTLELELDDGTRVVVDAEIRRRTPDTAAPHRHPRHQHH